VSHPADREPEQDRPWRIWIDTGGTFTDCVGVDPAGTVRRAKVLSTSALRGRILGSVGPRSLRVEQAWGAPDGFVSGLRIRVLDSPAAAATVVGFDPARSVIELDREPGPEARAGAAFEVQSDEEAPILAARLVTGTPPGRALPPIAMRLATTRGTNALLERRGAAVALFITRGLGDLLLIGTQQRPDLFALDIRRPAPLYQEVVEVPERLAADGRLIEPLGADAMRREARRVASSGIRTAAIALMHSWVNPRHEQELASILRTAGFEHVSVSSELSPLIKLLGRAQTTVVNAYLAPVIVSYLARVRSGLARPDVAGGSVSRPGLTVMTSAGGLVAADSFRPKDSLLSGPAGGVVGAASAARACGFVRVITFDMGGTSTDAARVDDGYEYAFEHEVAGAHIVAPGLAVESVAAGGGSVCGVGRDGLKVGPESAGASPGPACYGAGGPLTITDVNLLLGRVDPARFGIPIVAAAAESRLLEEQASLLARTGRRTQRDELLEGFLDIANERMADAIRRVSVRKGYAPAGYALVAFGGAGGQHACAVAARLGITSVVIPPDPGLLSAIGLGQAATERFAEKQVLRDLREVEARLPALIDELADVATQAMRTGSVNTAALAQRAMVSLRFAGQESSIAVDWDGHASLRTAFLDRYAATYGHVPESRPIQVESVRVAVSQTENGYVPERPAAASGTGAIVRTIRARFESLWAQVPVHDRATLEGGATLAGPALVIDAHSTCIIEPGWSGVVHQSGALVLTAAPASRPPAGARSTAGVAQAELFANRLTEVAREMGEMLRRTALSTNVKERLDFSCAVLDSHGQLVVNAPHIPVHLGAMGLCVRALSKALPMGPGDVVVTNHPAFGGSHLPDVTVVTPVFDDGATLLGYVASRAHHAEIGGTRPGSMPPDARTLAEEGVVIPPMHLIRGGRADWDALRRVFGSAPYPTRNVEENLADLAAAVAANHHGAAALAALAQQRGAGALAHSMDALARVGERRVHEALLRLGDGQLSAEEFLDDGSPIRVCITVRSGAAVIDFAGSAPVHPGNLNATPAIVQSAVIYVLRLLVSEAMPLSEGLMRPVELRIPPGMLSPVFPPKPAHCPAVAGGNTETSQRVVDTLLKALGLAACSQGTMNNVLFGGPSFGYYETVCGGAGAGRGFHGAIAVHTHMTNTRITDPEILESRYPVRLERFAIRRGSGGAGEFRGGDGVVREITFLEPASLSILSQHRTLGPYGLNGGSPGLPGAQWIVRATGEIEALRAIDGRELRPGDRLVLETPGGGGYGPPRR
jgi:5-oxoprolinase (ATP-hydrolysing)